MTPLETTKMMLSAFWLSNQEHVLRVQHLGQWRNFTVREFNGEYEDFVKYFLSLREENEVPTDEGILSQLEFYFSFKRDVTVHTSDIYKPGVYLTQIRQEEATAMSTPLPVQEVSTSAKYVLPTLDDEAIMKIGPMRLKRNYATLRVQHDPVVLESVLNKEVSLPRRKLVTKEEVFKKASECYNACHFSVRYCATYKKAKELKILTECAEKYRKGKKMPRFKGTDKTTLQDCLNFAEKHCRVAQEIREYYPSLLNFCAQRGWEKALFEHVSKCRNSEFTKTLRDWVHVARLEYKNRSALREYRYGLFQILQKYNLLNYTFGTSRL